MAYLRRIDTLSQSNAVDEAMTSIRANVAISPLFFLIFKSAGSILNSQTLNVGDQRHSSRPALQRGTSDRSSCLSANAAESASAIEHRARKVTA